MASAPPNSNTRGDAAYVQPFAAWQVMLDGKDLASLFALRLLSLKLSEKRGEATDSLEIELQDADGRLALPPEGAILTLALGWARGTGVALGMVAKGRFKVDDVSWSGGGNATDKISITARSADLKSSFRTRKNKIHKDTTLGAIVAQIAGDNGLSAKCHPDLAGIAVTVAEQANKSDMTFIRDLGRRYDAVATVKDRSLIFAPHNADTTASGKAIPSLTITRSAGDSITYHRAARENGHDGAEAQHHDQTSATRKTVKHGGSQHGSHHRRLKRVYASENDASHAAKAEANRIKRAEATLSLTLAYGDPALSAGAKAKATGFKAEIDAHNWRIASVEHTLDASGGFSTALELEVAG